MMRMVVVQLLCVLILSSCGSSAASKISAFNPSIDDWYYPKDEIQQSQRLSIPICSEIDSNGATLVEPETGNSAKISIGKEFGNWRVVEIVSEPRLMVVLERNFDRWGLLAYVDDKRVVAQIRKDIGRLDKIKQPTVRYPKDYFSQLQASQKDMLGEKVLAKKTDPSYDSVVGYLPELTAYTFVGSPRSAKKYLVMPDGTVGWMYTVWGKLKGKLEVVYFGPNDIAPEIRPTAVKRGRVGRIMPVADFGFYDTGSKRGYEQVVFASVEDSNTTTVHVRVTDTNGVMRYFQLEPLKQVSDGKAFYCDLLKLNRYWSDYFEKGMQIDVPEQRVVDNCKFGIAMSLSSCVGLTPKYGLGAYWPERHESFPPTTISLCRCLLEWGYYEQAKDRIEYYLKKYIKDDGTIDYYGPAVAEYGQLIELAAHCAKNTNDWQWFDRQRSAIERMVEWLLKQRLISQHKNPKGSIHHGLIYGSPEADNHELLNYYFAGDCWTWRGLVELAKVYEVLAQQRNDETLKKRSEYLKQICEEYRGDILSSVKESIIRTIKPPFLPPVAGLDKPFTKMTESNLSSYTNYRYWPEMLSSQSLGQEYEDMMIDYRRAYGGELLGMTRFHAHVLDLIENLDDWPIFHYAYSLLLHDDVEHFLLVYYSHLAHHQTQGTSTGFEQVHIGSDKNPGLRSWAAFNCVPCQLMTAMLTRWMLVLEQRDEDVLWLCRAVPKDWYKSKFSLQKASTRWGEVSFEIKPGDNLSIFQAEVSFAGKEPSIVRLRIRHPDNKKLQSCEVRQGLCKAVKCIDDYIEIEQPSGKLTIEITCR